MYDAKVRAGIGLWPLYVALLFCCGALGYGGALARSAEPVRVGVLVPEVREPYRSIFREIIAGIEKGLGGRASTYMLGESLDPAALRAWYAPERRDVVIALGTRAVQALRDVPNDLRVVIGAVRAVTDVPAGRYSGIGLAPDPERIFGRLKGIAPQVRRVLVVYGPERGEWLSARAQLAARKHGLQIDERVAASLHEAATLYREALADAKPTDVIWLPLNASPVDDRVILPMILEKAWERRLVVVSSNPAHVRRGVSFAFYPDNKGLGTSLAALALQGTGKGKGEVNGLQPLQDLLLAVNLRTAEHVGLHFSLEQKRDFDLVFPSP